MLFNVILPRVMSFRDLERCCTKLDEKMSYETLKHFFLFHICLRRFYIPKIYNYELNEERYWIYNNSILLCVNYVIYINKNRWKGNGLFTGNTSPGVVNYLKIRNSAVSDRFFINNSSVNAVNITYGDVCH